jgi:hypothetical protein
MSCDCNAVVIGGHPISVTKDIGVTDIGVLLYIGYRNHSDIRYLISLEYYHGSVV